MKTQELAKILKDMYDRAAYGQQVVNIHLFGIIYADTITRNHLSVKEIVAAAGLGTSYATEVSKGIRLAEFVILKE